MTNRKKGHVREKRFTLNLLFTLLVFLQLVMTMAFVIVTIALLVHWDVLSLGTTKPEANYLILYIALISIILGSLLSSIVSRIPLKPVNQVIDALNRLASGDFKTRLRFSPRINRVSVADELSKSFNIMAEELEKTEMLRTDFVNNFSHEFKTPIVSIAGFAKLLKRCNLPEEQRREYLDIIEEESLRLSAMATNVLNLTKVENQTILTDVTTYNLAEQLRTCVLLLEAKWERKRIEPELNLEELYIEGTEELLKQVWINLLDNAVKFSPEDSVIQMEARKTDSGVAVAIQNHGPAIPPEALGRIFTKFYQADGSHATEGNGVGLAIVKRVVDLHGGSVQVASAEGNTVFTVFLP